MDTIDLDAILQDKEDPIHAMKEAIRQALVLASYNAKVKEVYQDGRRKDIDGLEEVRIFNPNGPDSVVIVDKQSILDVEKLII